jgi:hypothetical protein
MMVVVDGIQLVRQIFGVSENRPIVTRDPGRVLTS